MTTEWGGGIILPLAPSSPDPPPPPRRGFACNALLDLWPRADMDLSGEQRYISARDTERWGRGRPCVLSADSPLVLIRCQFFRESADTDFLTVS